MEALDGISCNKTAVSGKREVENVIPKRQVSTMGVSPIPLVLHPVEFLLGLWTVSLLSKLRKVKNFHLGEVVLWRSLSFIFKHISLIITVITVDILKGCGRGTRLERLAKRLQVRPFLK